MNAAWEIPKNARHSHGKKAIRDLIVDGKPERKKQGNTMKIETLMADSREWLMRALSHRRASKDLCAMTT